MSSKLPTLQQVTNTVLTFARIVKDKSAYAIKTYMDDETHNVERLYPKKNFSEYISDQLNFFSEPTLVHPNLYLGSMYNALLWQTLVDNNIKYIVNVTDEVTNCYPKYIEYYQIPIKDDNNQSLLPYFDETYNKIEEFLNKGDGNVLVHCVFGASRSVTIVTEYLRRKTGKPIDEIIQELKDIRPAVNPTHKFIQDLNDAQNMHNSELNKNLQSEIKQEIIKNTELNESNESNESNELNEQIDIIKIYELNENDDFNESEKMNESDKSNESNDFNESDKSNESDDLISMSK